MDRTKDAICHILPEQKHRVSWNFLIRLDSSDFTCPAVSQRPRVIVRLVPLLSSTWFSKSSAIELTLFLPHRNLGLIIVKHCWNIFPREHVLCVNNQQTCLAWKKQCSSLSAPYFPYSMKYESLKNRNANQGCTNSAVSYNDAFDTLCHPEPDLMKSENINRNPVWL